MRINHKYHFEAAGTLDLMLDPQTNVTYSAQYLRRLKRAHWLWSAAVAAITQAKGTTKRKNPTFAGF